MPEIKLGTKYDCFSCGTKFYDLGKPEPICPKCGANQKDAGHGETAQVSPRARKRKVEVAKVVEIEEDEPIADIVDDEMVSPDLEEEDLGVDDEEEELDDET